MTRVQRRKFQQTVPARRPIQRLPALILCMVWGLCAGADWQLDITPDNALYPALDLSQAQRSAATPQATDGRVVGAGSGLIQVELRANHDAERVALRLDAEYLSHPVDLVATLPRAGERYVLRPALAWDIAALSTLQEIRTVNIILSLQRGDAPVQQIQREVRLHPMQEALYYVRDGSEHVDLSWIFAAYADPQSAVVDAMLAQAQRAHPELPFDGYASRDAAAVIAQAFALWEVLEQRGVRYADEDPGLARGPQIWSQRVRLHDDVWNQRRANCLDGSLLLAAALERLGVRSVLLLVPRHALLAFYPLRQDGEPVFVETTLLGARRLAAAAPRAFLSELSHPDADALRSFSAALDAGRTRHARDAAGFRRRTPDYQWIDLAIARSYGIMPLPEASRRSAPATVDGGR
ncbi:MAG: hypothetical protein ABI411_03000 [Tahibacter sp.]